MREYSFIKGHWDPEAKKEIFDVIKMIPKEFTDGNKTWQEYDTSMLDCSKYGRLESLDLYYVWKMLRELPPIYKCASPDHWRYMYFDFMIRHGLAEVIYPNLVCRSLYGELLLADLDANPPEPRTSVYPQEYNLDKLEYPDKFDLRQYTAQHHHELLHF